METEKPLAPLEDACTVVLLRDGASGLEVLMLERPGTSRAFAGAWVFPGGKVDPEDRIGAEGAALSDVQAAYVAGLREVAEETGQHLRPADVVRLSLWTPMHSIPRRFRTWFLVAAAESGTVALNPGEHADFAWLAPAEALSRHAVGAMVLAPPTWVTLHHLAKFSTVGGALAAASAAEPFPYETYRAKEVSGVSEPGGSAAIVWAGDEDHPVAGQAGARHRLTMTALPWVFEATPGNPGLGR